MDVTALIACQQVTDDKWPKLQMNVQRNEPRNGPDANHCNAVREKYFGGWAIHDLNSQSFARVVIEARLCSSDASSDLFWFFEKASCGL